MAPATANAKLCLDCFPRCISQCMLHLGERPGSLHVAELLASLIFNILHPHPVDRGRWLDNNGVEILNSTQHCGGPSSMANQNQVARSGIDITRSWIHDDWLNLLRFERL